MLRRSLRALDGIPSKESVPRWTRSEVPKTTNSGLGIDPVDDLLPKPKFTIGRDQLHFLLYLVPAGILYMFYVRPNELSEEEKHEMLEKKFGYLVRETKAQRDDFDRHFRNLHHRDDESFNTIIEDLTYNRVNSSRTRKPVSPPKIEETPAQPPLKLETKNDTKNENNEPQIKISVRRRWLPWNWFRSS